MLIPNTDDFSLNTGPAESRFQIGPASARDGAGGVRVLMINAIAHAHVPGMRACVSAYAHRYRAQHIQPGRTEHITARARPTPQCQGKCRLGWRGVNVGQQPAAGLRPGTQQNPCRSMRTCRSPGHCMAAAGHHTTTERTTGRNNTDQELVQLLIKVRYQTTRVTACWCKIFDSN